MTDENRDYEPVDGGWLFNLLLGALTFGMFGFILYLMLELGI